MRRESKRIDTIEEARDIDFEEMEPDTQTLKDLYKTIKEMRIELLVKADTAHDKFER